MRHVPPVTPAAVCAEIRSNRPAAPMTPGEPDEEIGGVIWVTSPAPRRPGWGDGRGPLCNPCLYVPPGCGFDNGELRRRALEPF